MDEELELSDNMVNWLIVSLMIITVPMIIAFSIHMYTSNSLPECVSECEIIEVES